MVPSNFIAQMFGFKKEPFASGPVVEANSSFILKRYISKSILMLPKTNTIFMHSLDSSLRYTLITLVFSFDNGHYLIIRFRNWKRAAVELLPVIGPPFKLVLPLWLLQEQMGDNQVHYMVESDCNPSTTAQLISFLNQRRKCIHIQQLVSQFSIKWLYAFILPRTPRFYKQCFYT